MGHYSRCSLLAHKLESMGYEVALHCYEDNGAMGDSSGGDFGAVEVGVAESSPESSAWYAGENLEGYLEGIDWVIIDSYQAPYEVYARALARVRGVIVIDDIARMVFPKGCIILNGGVDTARLYVGQECRVYAGVEFMICDERFSEVARAGHRLGYRLGEGEVGQNQGVKSERRQVEHLLLCFGGSDAGDLSYRAYRELEEILCEVGVRCVSVIVGGFYAGRFSHEVETRLPCVVYRDMSAKEVAEVFARSDLAISAGGRMLNELLLSQVPTLALPIAPNQEHQVACYAKMGALLPSRLENLRKDFTRALEFVPDFALREQFGIKLESTLKEILC